MKSAKLPINKIINILEKENLLTKFDARLSNNESFCDIFIKSQDIAEFIKENNSIEKPNFIYIARKGNKFDGHTLAEKVLTSGNVFIGKEESINLIAKNFNYSNEWIHKIIAHCNFIGVKNIEESIHTILESSFSLNNQNFNTIAVTGTNGKTSVTQICSQILEELYHKKNLRIGTLGVQIGEEILSGSHVTTPDYPSFLQILNTAKNQGISNIVMEATSHGLKENRLGNWKIDIAIFTNLTQDHLDYHKTMDDYKESKKKLFTKYLKEDGFAIICTNNNIWKEFAESAKGKKRKLIGVGYNDNFSQDFINQYKDDFESVSFLYVSEKKSSLNGISGILNLQNSKNLSLVKSEFKVTLIGEFQYDNILCAIAATLACGFSLNQITNMLSHIKNIPGRLEIVNSSILSNKEKDIKPTIIVDYAHSPDALEKAIIVCRNALTQEGKGKLITIFGCGGDRDKTKRPLMGKIAASLSDLVIVTSDNPRTEDPTKIIDDIFSDILSYKNCLRESDRRKAIALAIKHANEFDLILLAGKGHEDYQIVGDIKYPFSDAQVARSLLLEEKK